LAIICPGKTLGAGYLDVAINEIAWMGTETSPNDEWIELYNNSLSPIDMNGWKMISNDLNNNGEYLRLIDASGKIIDEIDCSEKWFFGDNEVKKTMERKNTLINGNDLTNWQTSKSSGGTPKNENSKGQKIDDNKEEEKSVTTLLPTKKDNGIQEPKNQSSFSSFLIAISIAVSSGAFVLFLKNKMDKEC